MIRLLLQRGDAAVAVGDIVAARLLYERAANLGSADGARSMGKTYDAEFLRRVGVHGIRADQAASMAWFRKAAVLGDRKPHAAMRAKPAAVAQAPLEDKVRDLLQRGDAAVAAGDVILARPLYERAAALGSASAATSAGKTYDIEFLLQDGAGWILADPAAATAWFRKAAALGDPEARTRLARLHAQSRP
jgi:TPR repeat protein